MIGLMLRPIGQLLWYVPLYMHSSADTLLLIGQGHSS
jgi:hypothetical protein